jgi:hypothetical protein
LFKILTKLLKIKRTRINGFLVSEETLLNHGDRIELGINHFFRINCPIDKQNANTLKTISSLSDFKYAQEEILLNKMAHQHHHHTDEEESNYESKSPDSSDSIDEHSVNLEYAIKNYEKNFPIRSKFDLSSSSSSSSLGTILT